MALACTSCVETAECDESVPCEEGRVCYDYACRTQCEDDASCGSEFQCVPCVQDDAQGTVDHCFSAQVRACVPRVEDSTAGDEA